MISRKSNFPVFGGPFAADLIPPAGRREKVSPFSRDPSNKTEAKIVMPVRAVKATEPAAAEAPKKTAPKLGGAKATAKASAPKAAAKPTAAAKAAAKPAKEKSERGNFPAAKVAEAVKAGSGQAVFIDLLARKKGATVTEIVEALHKNGSSAQEGSVRTFIPSLARAKGYGLHSEKKGDETTYFLLFPEGTTAPVPHTVSSAKASPVAAKKAPTKKTGVKAAAK